MTTNTTDRPIDAKVAKARAELAAEEVLLADLVAERRKLHNTKTPRYRNLSADIRATERRVATARFRLRDAEALAAFKVGDRVTDNEGNSGTVATIALAGLRVEWDGGTTDRHTVGELALANITPPAADAPIGVEVERDGDDVVNILVTIGDHDVTIRVARPDEANVADLTPTIDLIPGERTFLEGMAPGSYALEVDPEALA